MCCNQSEVKIYSPSGIQVITGCTKHPAPGQQYCSKHSDYQSPVLLPSQVSKDSLSNLNKQQKNMNDLNSDMLFIVEAIQEIKKEQVLGKKSKYSLNFNSNPSFLHFILFTRQRFIIFNQ